MILYSVVLPSPVTKLMVTNVSADTVSLSWVFGFDGHSDIMEVTIFYTTEANYENLVSDDVTVPEEGNGPVPTETTISGLEPYTLYSFAIEAVTIAGSSKPVTINETTLGLSKLPI